MAKVMRQKAEIIQRNQYRACVEQTAKKYMVQDVHGKSWGYDIPFEEAAVIAGRAPDVFAIVPLN